ncbi:MAG: hypothetical protein RSC04_05360 [Bacteroidales bacterium]
MKNTILFLSAFIFITLNPLQAKNKKNSESPKIETPEVVVKAFAKSFPEAKDISWTQTQINKSDGQLNNTDTWFFANFTNKDMKQRAKYHNNALYSVEFELEPQYYPTKIVQYTTDSIGLNYKITRMVIEQKQNNSVYFIEVSRGKKKNFEKKAFYFTIKGDFLKELPSEEVALDFLRFL